MQRHRIERSLELAHHTTNPGGMQRCRSMPSCASIPFKHAVPPAAVMHALPGSEPGSPSANRSPLGLCAARTSIQFPLQHPPPCFLRTHAPTRSCLCTHIPQTQLFMPSQPPSPTANLIPLAAHSCPSPSPIHHSHLHATMHAQLA